MAFFLLSLPVYADETEDIQDFSGMTELLDQLPEGLEKEEFLPLLEENGAGSTAFVWEKILSYFTIGVKDGIRTRNHLSV